MGFRNNVCYDRWEARNGANSSSSAAACARAKVLLAASTANPVGRIACRCIGFAYAGRAPARRGRPAAARPWVQQDEAETLAGCRNVPDALLLAINRDLAACLRRGELTDILYQALTQRAPPAPPSRPPASASSSRPRPSPIAAAPHRLAVLPAAALRAGGRAGIPDPGGGHHHRLHLLRPGRAGRRTGRPFGKDENDSPVRAGASSRSTCWKVWACGCRSRRCRWICAELGRGCREFAGTPIDWVWVSGYSGHRPEMAWRFDAACCCLGRPTL